MPRAIAAVVAAFVGIFFIFLSVDHGVYAPGAFRLHRILHHVYLAIFGEPSNTHIDVVLFLRKVYSVVAFAMVGVFVALAVSTQRRRYVVSIITVALVSAVIEVVQKLFARSPESFASNLFDVACGAVGGAIGAAIVDMLPRRAPRA